MADITLLDHISPQQSTTFIGIIFINGAIPTIPPLFLPAAMIPATFVPCPSLSIGFAVEFKHKQLSEQSVLLSQQIYPKFMPEILAYILSLKSEL